MNSIDLRVEGMTCASCISHVSAALAPLAGVAEVEVDLAAGRVRVSGEAEARALIAALRDAGYPAKVELPGPALAGGKSGGCGGGGTCRCQ